MKKFLAGVAFLTLSFAPVAHAEAIDLSTFKCSELAGMSDDEGNAMFVWLLGYVGGRLDSTVLNLDKLEEFGTQVGEYCADNPDVGLVAGVMEVVKN